MLIEPLSPRPPFPPPPPRSVSGGCSTLANPFALISCCCRTPPSPEATTRGSGISSSYSQGGGVPVDYTFIFAGRCRGSLATGRRGPRLHHCKLSISNKREPDFMRDKMHRFPYSHVGSTLAPNGFQERSKRLQESSKTAGPSL